MYRINNIITIFIKNAIKKNNNINELFNNISLLTEFLNKSDLKHKIVPKLRLGGKTRMRKYYHYLFSDLLFHNNNISNLKELLNNKEKLFLFNNINFEYLEIIFNFIKPFEPALNCFEQSSNDTINKVVPFYYN